MPSLGRLVDFFAASAGEADVTEIPTHSLLTFAAREKDEDKLLLSPLLGQPHYTMVTHASSVSDH
jgi:hypothetical protein